MPDATGAGREVGMATEQPRPNDLNAMVCGSCANRWGGNAWSNDCPHGADLRARARELEERNGRMREFIKRHGYGHTDWPEDKIGCEQPGPGCPGRCIARCEDVDNLNRVVYDLRARAEAAERALALAMKSLEFHAGDPHGIQCDDDGPCAHRTLADIDRLPAPPAPPEGRES